MTQNNQSNQYKKTLQHVTLWGCLANARYRQLGTVAAIAFTIGMTPQVSMASDINEAEFLVQLQAVEDALDLSYSPRIDKLIELSKQGNIAADMTLYRYKHRGNKVDYTPNTTNVTQAIQMLNSSADDPKGLVGLFKSYNYANGNFNLAKDYAKAIQWSKQAANKGNANAMAGIGYRYNNGEGVTQDYTTAMEWYKKAADKGNAVAMYNLGVMYRDGQGVTQDYTTAMNWYKKAADKGDADAMRSIGYLYRNGQGVTQNYSTAMDWYKKAANKGDASAMRNIGYLYREGKGVTQDYSTAMDWYKKAADNGIASAMNNIGNLYYNGQGITQNYTTAMSWYKKAADNGSASAMYNIGILYDEGHGVTQDYSTAMDWYKKAADNGSASAMYNIGILYDEGHGVTQDYTTAMSWYKKAADKGDTNAMGNMGYLYKEGKGVTQNYRTAMEWLKKAADKGDSFSMQHIGNMYNEGQGVTQDYTTAIDWYKKAAGKGDTNAMYNLGLMYDKGQGVAQDDRAAINWYTKAADNGNLWAMNNLGGKYSEEGITQDYTAAMGWYKKAANQGFLNSMVGLGYMYREGKGMPKDGAAALEWYKKAADNGYAPAMNNIGYMYKEGKGVPQDYTLALRWFQKALSQGELYAVFNIGDMFNEGLGVPQDSNKAAQFFVVAYEIFAADNNKSDSKEETFIKIKQNLETMLATDKITDPAIRKQVESIFAKPPLIAWKTQPPNTTNSETLSLSVLLTDQGGGIGDVRVLLDGIAIDQNSRGLTRAVNQTTRDFTLSIPQGEHTLTVEAYPEENVGITSTVSKQVTSTYAPIQKPKLHAVIIGIDQYNNPDLKLNYAAKDASAIYDVLNKQIGSIYDKGNISLLNTASTTSKDIIISKINQIKQTAKMNDVFVFYVAAHGYNYPDTGYHLFTSDVGATSSRQVTKTGINANDLQGMLAQVNTNKKLILLDTCDSGGSIDAGQLLISRGLDDQDVIDTMQRKSGATVIMASTDKQKALEGYQGHGVFTYGLLQAFNGAGDMNKDGYMKTGELSNYIEDEIPTIAQRAFSQPQYPTSSMIGNGFEFKVF
ncbi:caspase family protein [Psychrobacter sp. M13]|uniref:caspase family protein n=1 Tax=Psychrobacter sp. M13 TaxID=3067275 RepID=UPI00273C8B79|nr:caspase family protein [Psychrobacter sp. M13]WLP93359.1 caspase family protein [Psychrobacter sp. M13]